MKNLLVTKTKDALLGFRNISKFLLPGIFNKVRRVGRIKVILNELIVLGKVGTKFETFNPSDIKEEKSTYV